MRIWRNDRLIGGSPSLIAHSKVPCRSSLFVDLQKEVELKKPWPKSCTPVGDLEQMTFLQDSAHFKMRVNKISSMLKLCSSKPPGGYDQNRGSGPLLGLFVLCNFLFHLNLWATNVRKWELVSKICYSYGAADLLRTRKFCKKESTLFLFLKKLN